MSPKSCFNRKSKLKTEYSSIQKRIKEQKGEALQRRETERVEIMKEREEGCKVKRKVRGAKRRRY